MHFEYKNALFCTCIIKLTHLNMFMYYILLQNVCEAAQSIISAVKFI